MPTRLRALAPVLLVLVAAPLTAEYLIGYDDTTGNPAALLFGILLFGPIYGAPAVLIREVARRRGLGWASILLLATAFGLVQAGLIDQSLFDPDYRDIPYWQDLRRPTFLPWFGTSAYMAMTFVAGHVFGSVAVPVALAESWWPKRREEPWLGPIGIGVIVLLWAFGAWFLLKDQFGMTSFRISPGQLAGTVVVVAVLVVVALTRRRRPPTRPGTVPPPWLIALVTAVLLPVRSLVPTDWAWTLVALGAIGLWLVLVGRWSGTIGWDGRHTVGALAGVVLSIGGPAFTVVPLGDVPLAAKLASNILLLAVVLALTARGYLAERRALTVALTDRPEPGRDDRGERTDGPPTSAGPAPSLSHPDQ